VIVDTLDEPIDLNLYELDTTEVNKKYNIYFENKLKNCFLTEFVKPNEYAMVITDEKFNRPIGITRDGYSDTEYINNTKKINQYEQAKVMIKPGYHIIIFKYNITEINSLNEFPQVFIHRVESVSNLTDRFMFYANKTCKITLINIAKFDFNCNKKYGKYNFVLDFINRKIINTHIIFGSTPRFTVNPNRQYEIRLFVLENGEFVSYMDNGKKLVLHRKTKDYHYDRYKSSTKAKLVSGLLMRVYYTTKQLKYKDYIVVDGYSLYEGGYPSIKNESTKRNSKLLTVITKTGFRFPAFKHKGEIYPTYSSWIGIQTFKLNKYEINFIEKIEEGYQGY